MENYEKQQQLGSGSYGNVWKIRRRSDGKDLVWKDINFGKMSEREKTQLVAEVNILRELRNPFIVRYHDRIVDKPTTRLYIIMECCSGGDLGSIISKCKKDRTTLDESSIWKVFAQSILALKDCHRRVENGERKPILHRDLKPANMLLDAQKNIKLADFGLAKELSSQSKLAKTNVGTPYYMAPEIINEKDYDEKSDIWSLGCVMYELAALKPPFDAANAVSLAVKINKGSFQRIPSKYSDSLYEVIRRMLQVDPKRRPKIEDLELTNGIQSELASAKLILSEYRMQQSYVSKCRDIKIKEEELIQRESVVTKREEALSAKEQQLKSREETLQRQQRELEAQRAKLAKDTGGSSKTNGGHKRASSNMMMAIEENDSEQSAYFDSYAPLTDKMEGTHPSTSIADDSQAPAIFSKAANTFSTATTISAHPAYFNGATGTAEGTYGTQAPNRPFIQPQPPAPSSKTFSSFHSNHGKPPPPLPSSAIFSSAPRGKEISNKEQGNSVDVNGRRGPVPMPMPATGPGRTARPAFQIYSDGDSTVTAPVTTSIPSRMAPPIPASRVSSKTGEHGITTGAAYDKENVHHTLKGKVAAPNRYPSTDKTQGIGKPNPSTAKYDVPCKRQLSSAAPAQGTAPFMDSPFKRQKQF